MTNGEKYKTAKERNNAFDQYCEIEEGGNCNTCPCRKKDCRCEFTWLDLEAKKEKPMPCPFCGSEMKPNDGVLAHSLVCKDCGYNSPNGPGKPLITIYTEAEAIAAHNRVCKAVAAYKESEVK